MLLSEYYLSEKDAILFISGCYSDLERAIIWGLLCRERDAPNWSIASERRGGRRTWSDERGVVRDLRWPCLKKRDIMYIVISSVCVHL